MLKPKVNKANSIEVVTASCIGLYLAAKAFHLNTTGPSFYGDHKTFDGIAAMGEEWFDVFAERMRFLQMPVPASVTWVGKFSLIAEANIGNEAEGMLAEMLGMLEQFSAYLNTNLQNFDPTTQNMIQELDAAIGKQIYFIRSSM